MSKNRGQSEGREQRRANKFGRTYSNKKGIHLVVNRFYDPILRRVRFIKIRKRFQGFKGKRIVHYIYGNVR